MTAFELHCPPILTLVSQAEYDPRFLRSDQYLAAKLLQSVQGYCGASRRLFELSESSRSSLVHNARSMGLFCYKPPPISECLDVEDRWHQWINQEKYRRLGWMVYVSLQPPKLLYSFTSIQMLIDICTVN